MTKTDLLKQLERLEKKKDVLENKDDKLDEKQQRDIKKATVEVRAKYQPFKKALVKEQITLHKEITAVEGELTDSTAKYKIGEKFVTVEGYELEIVKRNLTWGYYFDKKGYPSIKYGLYNSVTKLNEWEKEYAVTEALRTGKYHIKQEGEVILRASYTFNSIGRIRNKEGREYFGITREGIIIIFTGAYIRAVEEGTGSGGVHKGKYRLIIKRGSANREWNLWEESTSMTGYKVIQLCLSKADLVAYTI